MARFQFFAEAATAAGAEAGTEAAESPAGAETVESPARAPFEDLIRGEYKEDFRKKTEEILRKRFKNQPKADPETGYRALLGQAEAAKAAYPDFDLRQELRAPRFAALVLGGVDAKTAYEAVHHEELLRRAMAFGVRQASIKLSSAQMSGRPPENGGQAASVSRVDPRSLTRQQREEIRRRVLEKGERGIRF
ncbi:MAG: hypothetical protein VB055_03490 [Oscillospiraceae bacterium]|nr:hypothetical protein [Oscillospiraceae bacterium]